MESFFALRQKNLLNRQRWTSRNQLRLAIISWIERTNHRRRRQRRLGRLTPSEYETITHAADAAQPEASSKAWAVLSQGGGPSRLSWQAHD